MTIPSDAELHEIVHRVVQHTILGMSVPASAAPGIPVALGADHGGFAMKESLKAFVAEQGYQVIDCGTNSTEGSITLISPTK